MSRTRWLLACASCLLIAACMKSEGADAAQESKLSDAGKLALANIQGKRPPEQEAVPPGITVGSGSVVMKPSSVGDGQEIEISGLLKNGSTQAIPGVSMLITLLNDKQQPAGGHSTEIYFDPPIPPGSEHRLIVRAPLIGGSFDTASSARFEILRLVDKAKDDASDAQRFPRFSEDAGAGVAAVDSASGEVEGDPAEDGAESDAKK